MNYIEHTLLPNEKLIFHTKPHFIIFYPCIVWLMLFIATLLFLPKYLIFIYAALTLTIFSLLSSLVTYISSEYGITDKRIFKKIGLIRRTSLEIFFHKTESITISQSILGRILNYGTVIICGTGSSKDYFFYIPEPLKFRRRIQEQIEFTTSKIADRNAE